MKQQVKISKVKGNPSNPRIIKNDKFKKLVKSIKEFPEMLKLRPIVVDEDFMVLGGNMRLKASKEAGLKEVWIDIAEGLTEEQKKEFIVKDNVGFGEWDWDILANEWDIKQLEEWGLDGFPFEDKTLEAEEDNFEVPDEIKTDIVIGDLFEIGEHRLLCGDSTCSDTVAKLMNGEKADMVFTDPPYNVSVKGKFTGTIKNDSLSDEDFDSLLQGVVSNISLVNKGSVYVCYEIKNHNQFESKFNQLGNVDEIIIWNKDSASFYSNDKYNRKYEAILFIQGNGQLNCKAETNVWDYAKSSSFNSRDENNKRFNEKGNFLVAHPTTKPVKLVERAISNSSKKQDIILDLFGGSGSTMVASHQLKRKCYGMELDPKYCQVIIDRMKKLDSNLVIKRNGIELR